MKTEKQKKIIRLLITFTVMAFIFIQSALNKELSGAESGFIEELIKRITGTESEFLGLLVRKCAHFTEFMILGGCLFLNACDYARDKSLGNIGMRREILAAFLIGTLYAVTDELHQIFVPGRACMATDVCIDAVGVLTGTFVAAFLLRNRFETKDSSASED